MKKCYQTNYLKKEYFKEVSFQDLNKDEVDSTIYIKTHFLKHQIPQEYQAKP